MKIYRPPDDEIFDNGIFYTSITHYANEFKVSWDDNFSADWLKIFGRFIQSASRLSWPSYENELIVEILWGKW